jgi:uncharacterized integral membrane protein
MNSVKLIVALLLGTVLVVFGAQNTQAVTLHFLLFKLPSEPLVLALSAAVFLGALLAWIVTAPGQLRRRRERHGLEGQVQAQQQAAGLQNQELVPPEHRL